jgi:predicted enzyme related to lactoylglutathione lyase
MDWKLEVVPVPVTDVDRAKRFYGEQVGFVVDLDTRLGDEMRLVQLTPPGSGCSIHLSTGILDVPPGVLEGLQIVVPGIEAARAELVERGVDASPVQHMAEGVWVEGRGGVWN